MSESVERYNETRAACAAVFDRYTDNPKAVSMPTSGEGVFVDLALRHYDTWVGHAQPTELDSVHIGGVQHGFEVCGRGMARCTEAYEGFTQDGDHSAKELHGALVNPTTVRFFTWLTSQGGPKAHNYEQWLGLKRTRSVNDGEFLVESDPQTGLYFAPNPQILKVAEDEFYRLQPRRGEVEEPQIPAHKVCSAKHYIPRVWRDLADAALEGKLLEAQQSTADIK